MHLDFEYGIINFDLFSSSAGLTENLIGKSISNKLESMKRKEEGKFGSRDIHVVIGYYQGNNLPWIHQDNLTDG